MSDSLNVPAFCPRARKKDLSALSTAVSFGVLGFSRIPVIHALGLTVALIVVVALAIVELEPLAHGEKR